MDTAQWPQAILMKPMEEIIAPNTCSSSLQINSHNSVDRSNINNNNNVNNNNNKGGGSSTTTPSERKVRPQKDQAVNCPRCNSTNTKFCYYNNYSLTQPRYFCKTCRRYWTEGGSLRNIPVGGGSRKNKRSTSFSNYSSNHNNHTNTSKKLALDPLNLGVPNSQTQNPKDLNLGFSPNTTHQEFRSLSEFTNLPIMETTPKTLTSSPNHHHHHHLSALELLNGLTSSSRGLTPFMPMPMSMSDPNGVYSSSSSGFPAIMQDFKPTLNFSLDGFGGYNGSLQGQQPEANGDNNGRLLFPFEDLKQVSSNNDDNDNQNDSSTNDHQQARDQQGGDSSGYWSGMLGMGGSW